MADDIFVGSVSVGVVPDLRGFNTRMRRELLPAANELGKAMGREITKGVTDGLDMARVIRNVTPKAVTSSGAMGRLMGKEAMRGFAENFNIGKIVVSATAKAKVEARLAGRDLGETYGRAFRSGLDDALKDIKARVDVEVNRASLARAKAEVRRDVGKVKADVSVGVGGGAAAKIERELGIGGAGGGGFIGGINALIKALPGGTAGSIGAVPAPILAGAGAIGAAALPFIAQMLAGIVPLLGGGAITGLGIAGAFGLGGTTQAQVAQARAASQAANARLRAAQARLAGLGGGGASGLSLQAAQDRLAAAQARLVTARGGTSAAAILSAEAGVASAQDRLNKLRGTGRVSTAQLASAEAQLASARAAQAKSSQAYQKAQQDQITAGQERVRAAFKNLALDAQASLSQIGAPMAPVMTNIFNTVDKVMKKLTPLFTAAVQVISGPFQTFVDTILNAFNDPQVKSSIVAVTTAFVDVMKAFTPDLKGIMDSFADAIERIANSVSKNPKAFADFLNFIFQFGIMLLNAIAYLSDFAAYVETHFMPAMHDIAHIFDLTRHWVAVQWDQMWQDTIGRTIRAQRHLQQLISDWLHNIAHWFDVTRHRIASDWDQLWQDTIGSAIRAQRHLEQLISDWLHNIANAFDVARHTIASIWDLMWNNTIGRAQRGAQDLVNIFTRLKTNIINWFHDAVNWLSNAGKNIITGLWNGIKSAMSGIGNFVKTIIVDPIVKWVKHHFGIASPSTVMAGLGTNLIEGLLKGLMSNAGNVGKVVLKIFGSIPNALGAIVNKGIIAISRLPASALKLLGNLGGKFGNFFAKLFHGGPLGSGVERWLPLVKIALMLNNLPDSLAPQVLYQMRTESGGDPNAINLTDINAQRGDPSRGLMQTIGSTFAAYHIPGTSNNIYDPLANIAAAINYAKHVYGPTLMRGGMGMGSGHGYAGGTGGAAPGWAWVGERGPELVHFSGGETVVSNSALSGYQSGTSSAAAIAASNRAARAAAAASRRAAAAALAAANRMANAGASLAAALAKITTATTASVFASDQAKFLADLRLYFTPSVAKARSQLVINQIKAMQDLQTHIKTLSTNIANAAAYQQQELQHLRSTGGIGAIGIQGVGAAGGRSILSGLARQVTDMRNFGLAIRDLARAGASQDLLKTVAAMDPASGSVYARKMITALRKMHSMKLSPEMINQLVALGPDAALAYLNAIQAAGPSAVKQFKTLSAELASATVGTSRGIASVVAGGAYNTGANFVAGLKSQEKALENQFAHLGRVLGEEAIKWMHVPYNKRPYGYASGGWIDEPISGVGMYTGAFYTFAETGREYVMPEGQMGSRGGDGGTAYHAHFDGLTLATIESQVRQSFRAMALQQGALNRAGRRLLCLGGESCLSLLGLLWWERLLVHLPWGYSLPAVRGGVRDEHTGTANTTSDRLH